MTKEQYVSFETSKLLKAKGFDWRTEFVWYEHLPLSVDWRNKANQKAMDYFYFNETTEHHSSYGNCDKKPSYISGEIYSAPTIQMALRWLKDTHGLWVVSIPCSDGGFYFTIYKRYGKFWKDNVYDHTEYESFDEPECAVESGINYSLIHLIYDERRTD